MKNLTCVWRIIYNTARATHSSAVTEVTADRESEQNI